MTESVQKLYDFIREKRHHKFRKEFPYDIAQGFADLHLSPIERMGQRFIAVMAAEGPVILEGEHIVLLRTIKALPPLFTEEEWQDIKSKHYIHEHGYVCNISPNYALTIASGLEARKKEVIACQNQCLLSEDKEGYLFLKVVASDIDALLDLADRYRNEAIRIGRLDIAAILERVPRYGATNFLEALQFFRFLHFSLWIEGEYHNTIGRFDQYLFPYLQNDLDNGTLTEEQAFDLLEEFFLSFNRDSDLYPGVQQGDNGQSLVLGGTALGRDLFNKLSEMCLRASKELHLIDPKINIRVSSLTPDRVFELGTELTKEGLGFPQYSNDDVVIPALISLGYQANDAQDYVVAACWEFIVPGKGMDIPNIAALNFPAIVDHCIHEPVIFEHFEQFLEEIKKQIFIEVNKLASDVKNLWMIPAPFMSLLMEGCIDKARDISYGCKYNNYGFHGTGISTAVDSLAAIRKYIYEDKSLSWAELLDAIDKDFAGHEELLSKLRYEAPKMGNADPKTDSLASFLLSTFADATENLHNDRGGRIRAGTGSAMYYIWHARDLGASPDGRRKGEWFSANYSPSLFARVAGPLSIVKSFARPELKRTINGGPLTMEFHSTLFQDKDSIEKVASLVRLFMKLGGHQFQLNAVNREALLDAQLHPERYGNLIVRVWGWSAYFVELNKEYQDHVIRRKEYSF